ncbi:uncharacterized protein LOC142325504 [Lycorma delicatula]|uniref:uncharacterized protein LOC142325504 n=1 Tax=Lycorma delicatula TaxID=130591 RepID=UPI003F51608B
MAYLSLSAIFFCISILHLNTLAPVGGVTVSAGTDGLGLNAGSDVGAEATASAAAAADKAGELASNTLGTGSASLESNTNGNSAAGLVELLTNGLNSNGNVDPEALREALKAITSNEMLGQLGSQLEGTSNLGLSGLGLATGGNGASLSGLYNLTQEQLLKLLQYVRNQQDYTALRQYIDMADRATGKLSSGFHQGAANGAGMIDATFGYRQPLVAPRVEGAWRIFENGRAGGFNAARQMANGASTFVNPALLTGPIQRLTSGSFTAGMPSFWTAGSSPAPSGQAGAEISV